MSKQSFKICFCFRRIFRLKVVEPPEDIQTLFGKYAENGTMTVAKLLDFLINFQGESNATEEDAQAIFNSLKHLNIFQRKGLHLDEGLHLDAFFRYLLGDLNPPHCSKLHHDMNAPVAHYFLFTGHNSYLTGNQFSSKSSVRPIIKALLQGVRVIELDLWPNRKKNGVEVRHGGTLTSPVELIKCLRAIKDNAFVASDYPVVITFEDHLTADLQEKVAKMVTETFEGMLYIPSHHSECIMEFPSPESLKRKILISTKPPEYPESQRPRERATDKMDIEQDDQNDQDEKEEIAIPGYKQLIAIHAGKPKRGLDMWHIDPSKVRRLSLSEQQLENAAGTRGSDIIRFTQRNLLRIYPNGTRLNSSNYNPMLGWTHGAQMVAFNMQGHGKHLRIMEGMFRANGGCGYVKKPDFLLSVGPNNEVFDPDQTLPVKQILKVKVYMGEGWHSDFHRTHFDWYSPPDFYVWVGIAGVPNDRKMMKTQTINNQWEPVWNEEFSFPLSVPELAVLRVEVREYDNSAKHDFGGQTCLPIPELRTGIRAVPLYSERGQKYKSVRLLMKFEFDENLC